jgi:hypothetical protein
MDLRRLGEGDIVVDRFLCTRPINLDAHVIPSRSHDTQHVISSNRTRPLARPLHQVMTSRAKPKAMPTRASTRSTRATAQIESSIPAPTRGARAAAAKSSRVMAAQTVGRSLIRNESPLTTLHRAKRKLLLLQKEEFRELPPKMRSPLIQTESQSKYPHS